MIYMFCGHLGSGKTLSAITMAVEQYLDKGKRVASNMTIYTDKACFPQNRNCPIKLPGIPTPEHLNQLGRGDVPGDWADDGRPVYTLGDQKYDESAFGFILLDEAGTWLNARDWNDKDRRGVFQWITHARKLGWDVGLIIQDYESLDAQIRRSITEVYVACRRTDRIKLPYLPVRAPRLFMAFGKYGGPHGLTYKTWMGSPDAFEWYDTAEAVRADVNILDSGEVIDARGTYSLLSAWHLRGRYLRPKVRRNLGWWICWLALRTVQLLVGGPLRIVGGLRSMPPTIQTGGR